MNNKIHNIVHDLIAKDRFMKSFTPGKVCPYCGSNKLNTVGTILDKDTRECTSCKRRHNHNAWGNSNIGEE